MVRRAQPPVVVTAGQLADAGRRTARRDRRAGPGRGRRRARSSPAARTCSRPPAPTRCRACTARPASRARPARGCACSARWRSSRRGMPATCSASRDGSPASGGRCPPPSSWPPSAPTAARIDEVLQHYPAPVLAAARQPPSDERRPRPAAAARGEHLMTRPGPRSPPRRRWRPLAVHRIGCVRRRRAADRPRRTHRAVRPGRVGLRRRRRAGRPPAPQRDPARLHRHHRPALAAGRQGVHLTPDWRPPTRSSRCCPAPTGSR